MTDELPAPTTAPEAMPSAILTTPREISLDSLAAPSTDPWVVRIVAGGLVVLSILVCAGLIVVGAFANGIPPSARIAALGTAGAAATTAIGAAAALLASTRSRSSS